MPNSDFSDQDNVLDADDQKQIALDLILDAWEAALAQGVQPEILATTAIFAAMTDMVDIHGEEIVAEMTASLPTRLRAGEFTLDDADD